MSREPPRSTHFPSPTLFRSGRPRFGRRETLAPERRRQPEAAERRRDPAAVAAPLVQRPGAIEQGAGLGVLPLRSEEHTSELQSRQYLVCRLLLEKKKQSCTQ